MAIRSVSWWTVSYWFCAAVGLIGFGSVAYECYRDVRISGDVHKILRNDPSLTIVHFRVEKNSQLAVRIDDPTRLTELRTLVTTATPFYGHCSSEDCEILLSNGRRIRCNMTCRKNASSVHVELTCGNRSFSDRCQGYILPLVWEDWPEFHSLLPDV